MTVHSCLSPSCGSGGKLQISRDARPTEVPQIRWCTPEDVMSNKKTSILMHRLKQLCSNISMWVTIMSLAVPGIR